MPTIKNNSLSLLFKDISNKSPIAVKNPALQRAGQENSIFSLRKNGKIYWLSSISDKKNIVAPDGLYLFVILVDDPVSIYCSPPQGSAAKHMGSVEGHTSISNRKSVLYAGELNIKFGGELFNWSNCSGHYLPIASLNQANLHPYLRTLLPEEKFRDWESKEHREDANQNLLDRGYFLWE